MKTFTIDSSPLVPKANPAADKPANKQSSMHPQKRPTGKPKNALAKNSVATNKASLVGDQRAISLGYCCELHMLAARFGDESRLKLRSHQ